MARLLKMSEKMILFLPAIYSLLTDLKPYLIAFFFLLLGLCGFLVLGFISCISIVLKVKVFIWDLINDGYRKGCFQGPASFLAYEI